VYRYPGQVYGTGQGKDEKPALNVARSVAAHAVLRKRFPGICFP